MRFSVLAFLLVISLASAQNLIPNPSFETNTNWVFSDYASGYSTAYSRTGSRSASLLNDFSGVEGEGNHNIINRNIPGVISGKEYELNVYVKGVGVTGIDAGGKPLTVLKWKNAAGTPVSTERYMWAPYGTYDFRSMKIYLQAPDDAEKVDITFRSWYDCTGGTTYWDDVQLVERVLPTGTIVGTYQAESADLKSGGAVASSEDGYTGTGYYVATSDGYLQWNNVPGGGERNLLFRYSWEGNTRPFELLVNGVSQGVHSPMTATGRRGSWASHVWTVNLPNAQNTVRLKIGSPGGEVTSPMIDKLDVYSSSTVPEPDSTAVAWNQWEHTLSSSKTYTNPYKDVTVSVTYTGPGGRTITGKGFWDNEFRIRNMFPVAGTWTWRTTCSDTTNTGLHNKQGTVEVTAYSGSNQLYQHGYIRVSDNDRYLTYDDGTPFFWMGDTPWAAFIAASQSEWESYVDKRASQHFTVLQVHSNKGWVTRTADREGNTPFIGSGSTLRWNPAYWQGVDEKVRYANDHGILVFFAAVRQPGPGVDEDDAAQVVAFARNLAGRYMGSFVAYSPIADDLWTSMADVSGNELRESTSVHLIGFHPRFKWEPVEDFFNKPYVQFAGLQSGAGWLHDPYLKETKQPFSAPLALQQAYEWPYDAYQMTPTKPVLNLEISYDAKAIHDGVTAQYASPYPIRTPRSACYLSMLNGAKGFTYGVAGLWNWGVPTPWLGDVWGLQECIDQPSGNHMKYLHEIFSSVDWWNLVPRNDLIKNQASDWLKKMALSATPDRRQAIAYLQDNANIQIDMSSFPGTMTARWFNPETGSYASTVSIPNSGVQTITKPTALEDAVLVLIYGGTVTPTCASTGGTCCTGKTCSVATVSYGDCSECCPSSGSCTSTITGDMVAHYTFDQSTGSVLTDSAGSHDGTITGAVWTSGHDGNALSFDGTDDRVDLGNLQEMAGLTEFTLSAWFNADDIPADGLDAIIWQHDDWSNFYGLRFDSPNQGFYGSIRNDGEICSAGFPYSDISTGNWYHVAFTFDSGVGKIYLDGELKGECSNSALSSVPDLDDNMLMGSLDYVARNYYDGKIDEVAIYPMALSAAEILDLYNGADTCISIETLLDNIKLWKNNQLSIGEVIAGINSWLNC